MSELSDICTHVLAWAAPGVDVEVYGTRREGLRLTVRDGEIDTVTASEAAGVGVRVEVDGRQGFAYTDSLAHDAVLHAFLDAYGNARCSAPDDFGGLPEPDAVPLPTVDLWADDVRETPFADKAALVLAAAARAQAGPYAAAVHAAVYADATDETVIVNSRGVRAEGRSSRATLRIAVLVTEGPDCRTGSAVASETAFASLDPEAVADEAVARGARLLGGSKPKSGRVVVVFEPRPAAAVLQIVGDCLSGDSAVKGRSPFSDRVGERVAAPAVSLLEDPTQAQAHGAAAFDGEGLACRPVTLIEDGVLKGFLHHTRSSRRAGTRSTASASRSYREVPGVRARALALAPGEGGLDEMLARTGDALLVQEVTGLNSGVNTSSGDVSVGVQGLMVRGGAPGAPVREATIATTVPRLLADVIAIGGERHWLPGRAAGSLLVVDGVALSGR